MPVQSRVDAGRREQYVHRMNSVAVMGAGGVGGHYGAVLAQAGRKVAFIARGAHLAAMRSSGLTVERDGLPTIVLPEVVATDDPAAVGPVDLVLFTPKAFDLEVAAEQIAPLLGPGSAVLPLLNGIDIADRLAAVIGREPVLAGICQISSNIARPGLIRQVGPLNRIVLGEVEGGLSPRAEAIGHFLREAGIRAEVSERMKDEVWKKFYFLDPMASACALTGAAIGPVREDPDTRALLLACLEEVRGLGEAEGVSLPTPAEAITALERLPADVKPSLLHALERGAPLEIDILPGAVVRLGRRRGIPTPTHALIYAALKFKASGRRP